jgi:protein O-GlcNAc transferase
MFKRLLRVLRGPQAHGTAADLPPTPVASTSVSQLLAEGNRLLDGNHLSAAIGCYERALDIDGRSLPAAVNLGFALLEQGQHARAVLVLDGALESDAAHVDARYLRARAALEMGDAVLAVAHAEQILRIQPDFAPARSLHVRALAASGRLEEARAAAETALGMVPGDGELHLLRGHLLLAASDEAAALPSFQRAVEIEPRSTEVRLGLAQCLAATGRIGDARSLLQQLLAERPVSAAMATQLGNQCRALGDTDAAITAYRAATELDRKHGPAWQNLGVTLMQLGRHDEAVPNLERARDLGPDDPESWCNLGVALLEVGRAADAEQSFGHAQRLVGANTASGPASGRVLSILGVQALERGDTEEAIASFERAIAADPTALATRSYHLFALTYIDAPQTALEAAREYGRQAAAAAKPCRDARSGSARAPRDTLRVGLVSGDLYAHPVGHFAVNVLAQLQRRNLELVAFPTSHHNDEITAALQSSLADWLPLSSMSDAAAAQRIRDARIDVLLDLSGHTAHNRLPVFCWRPAPVQASWLGYWATTGVEAIDWVLADPLCVGEVERTQFTERVWVLPRTRLCFTPPGAPERYPVSALPANHRGVTFGCMQNAAKAGNEVLHAWRRILESVPDSRLRLQSKQTGASARDRLLERLAAAGIPAERVVLAPPAPRAAYLAGYAEIDLLLDTFPFPGGTTTCEALWMGVPTVTLAGRSMVANQGKALLTLAGLPDWVAVSVDDYVRKAIAFASDLCALARLRSSLRAQVLSSPLFDAHSFADDLSGALRGMHQAAA